MKRTVENCRNPKKNRWPYTLILTLILTLHTGLAFGQRLAISANIGNIRSGPGTNYDVMWQVEQYHPISIIEKKGTWYHFRDFEADEGWIHQSLVQEIPTVITAKPKCNVRSGPGTKYGIAFTVEKGIPFKVLKRKGNWLHVIHADGDKGWIHNSLVW